MVISVSDASAPAGMVTVKRLSSLIAEPPAAPMTCEVALPSGEPTAVGCGVGGRLFPPPGVVLLSPPHEMNNNTTGNHERGRFIVASSPRFSRTRRGDSRRVLRW